MSKKIAPTLDEHITHEFSTALKYGVQFPISKINDVYANARKAAISAIRQAVVADISKATGKEMQP